MAVATKSYEASVAATYRHHQRVFEPGEPVRLGAGWLKWYVLHRPGSPLPPGLVEETQAFLRAEVDAGRLDIDGQAGFVMLHLADAAGKPDSVALLLVSTWRYANEMWESVYVRHLDRAAGYERVAKGDHAATYCVWELTAVWHERNAWSRFLDSARDAEAERAYLADRFEGIA
jgi:hypothetical protein